MKTRRLAELCKPKEKVKEIARDVRSDKNLRALSRSLAEISRKETAKKLVCIPKRAAMKEEPKIHFEREIECNEDLTLVAKSIKGAAKMKSLVDGMRTLLVEILESRRKFPIDGVRDVYPEQYTKLFGEVSKSPEKSQVSFALSDEEEKVNEKEREIAVACVDPMIDEILNCVDEVVQRIFNNRTLKRAEEERSKRQDESRRKEKEKEEKREAQRKNEEKYKKLADKVLERLLSCAVEKISDCDSLEYIRKTAREIDDEACNSTESESEIVEKLVREFLLPEIEKRADSRLLLGNEIISPVVDDDFEQLLSSILLEEVQQAEMICKDLLQEIVNKIEM